MRPSSAAKGLSANSVYRATKATVRSFARTWTTDLRDRRIRVNAVSPGSIDTSGQSDLLVSAETGQQRRTMIANRVPLGRFGTPDELAKAVGLTAPSVNERIRKLERSGVIRGYVALLDERKLGHDITAFVEIFIEHPKFESGFIEAVGDLDEVLECHHITGEFSLLLKVRVKDMAAFRRLLIEKLNTVRGVRQTRTLIVLATSKEQRRIKFDSE